MSHPSTKNLMMLRKQDSLVSLLLAFFLLTMLLTAARSHGHILAGFGVILFLGLSFFLFPSHALHFDTCMLFYTAFLVSTLLLPLSFPSVLSAVIRLSFLLARRLSPTKENCHLAFALAGAVAGSATLWELITGRGTAMFSDGMLLRASGPFGNPNLTAFFLLPCLIFTLDACIQTKKKGRLWYLFAACLALGGLFATYCRGAWLSAAAAILYLAVYRFGFSLSLITLLSFIPLFSLCLPPSLLSRLSTLLSPDSSVSYRFSLWQSFLRLPFFSLLFGAGEGKAAFLALLSPVMAAGLEHVEHAHSLFLHLIGSVGLFGLVFFLLFLVSGWRRKTPLLRAVTLSLLLFGIFDDPLYSGQTEVLFWFLLGLN